MNPTDPSFHREHCISCAGTGTVVLMDDEPEPAEGPGLCPICKGAGAVMASTRFAVTFTFDDEVEAREFARAKRPASVREWSIAKVD
jgi:hypothetical protein